MQKVYFELLAPEKLLFSEEAEMVVLPGSEGDFGVLAKHSPIISTMRPGIITVYRAQRIAERIFVSGGFVEVTGNTLTALVEEAMFISSLRKSDIELQLALTQEAVQLADTQTSYTQAMNRLNIVKAMLDFIQE